MGAFTPEIIAEIGVSVREQRNRLLEENVDKFNGVRFAALTPELQQQWLDYRQQLLDVPNQEGFPLSVIFPEVPPS